MRRAIHAIATELLPELNVWTPALSASRGRLSMALAIGRSLNEPVGCRFSSFR
jgi:hypothetical protein